MDARKLKGVILSVEDTLLNMGQINQAVFSEVVRLMAFFKLRGIRPVLMANQARTIKLGGVTRDLYGYLEEQFDDLVVFTRLRDSAIPPKPKAAATEYVLKAMNWASNEVVYIGSNDDDMRTAVNGNILFLRAIWYSHNTNYGFEFKEVKEIARFIDTLCLRAHFWSHVIKDGDFEFYALAPFSTYKEAFRKYSENGRAAAKFGQGDVDFWLGALVTSMYFTGIHSRIDYVTSYPGHQAGFDNNKMSGDLMTFAKCFRKSYLHNLVIRHTTAIKSQTARNLGAALDHHNQLNTIMLNQLPARNYPTEYKNAPLQRGKTVLLVDDICTKGYSLETGRKLIEATGAKTILISWLKTINTDYWSFGAIGNFNPYQKNTFRNVPIGKIYGYHSYHVDGAASEELAEQLEQYINWDWPVS